MVTKQEMSKALMKVKSAMNKSKEYQKIDSVTTNMYCCGSCHSAKMENEHKDNWYSVKFFNSGMNKVTRRGSKAYFEEYIQHYIAYSSEDLDQVHTFCELLQAELIKFDKFIKVVKPESIHSCILVKDIIS